MATTKGMTDLPMAEINVRVASRVRPLLPKERLAGEEICARVIPDTNQIIMAKDRGFTFDHVFSPKSDQQEIYDTCVHPLVENIFEGYNSTVFAYGQTGSGKTYTIGTSDQECLLDEEKGIIPRAIEHIYHYIESKEHVIFTVKASFIEIYKEEVRDLLDCGPGGTVGKEVHIREDEHGQTLVCGVSQIDCPTRGHLVDCLETGSANRITGMTQMNELSSRSHCVFTVTITQEWKESLAAVLNRPVSTGSESNRSKDNLNHCISGKFHFVDLAGSERAHKTGNVGDRFKESIHINSGLLALGNVISALGDPKKKKLSHIPYRESKITRILKDSLGGNARTLMICCIAPNWSNFDESVNALKYANRARNIRNRPVVNRDKTSVKLEEMQSEILALREALSRQRGKSNMTGIQADWHNKIPDSYGFDDDDGMSGHASSYTAEVTRLRIQCDHYGQLVSKARETLESVVELSETIPDSVEQGAREWLDLASEMDNRVPGSLAQDPTADSSKWESATVAQLRRQLDQAKSDLCNDEDIFAEKAREINEKQSRIEKLNRLLVESESKLSESENRCHDLETHVVELQRKLDQMFHSQAHRNQLNGVNESGEDNDDIIIDDTDTKGNSMGGDGAPLNEESQRRVKSVPAHRHNPRKSVILDMVAARDIKTSPALFSIDRVMQTFRARSQLLASQLEDEDHGLRQEFPDATPPNNGMDHSTGAKALERKGTFRIKKAASTAPASAGTVSTLNDGSMDQSTLINAADQYKKQIKVSHLRLTEANQKLRDLAINIRMKEQLIKELVKSSKDTSILNRKYESKIRDLEIEKEHTSKEYSELQKKIEEFANTSKENETVEMKKIKEEYEKKTEEARKRLLQLQKKQRETEKMASFSINHEKKIQDLGITIERMKQEQINLGKKLKEEAENKSKLERDLQRDQERIKQLEIRNEQQTKILKRKQEEIAAVQKRLRRGSGAGLGDDQEKLEEQRRWLDEEVERVLSQKRQMDDLEADLRRREEMLAKKESVLTEKAQLEMKKMRASQHVDKDYAQMSARLDSAERELLDKQRRLLATPEGERARAEKEMVTLREERERLQAMRRQVEAKLHGGGLLNDKEERRMIELDEAIDALDEAIQYKDELIQDKRDALRHSQRDVATIDDNGIVRHMDSRENLFGRLQRLEPEDSRQLLMRYFDKVVSLREEMVKKDLSQGQMEVKLDENQRLLDQLKRTLEKQAAEMDRRITHQQQLFEQERRSLMEQISNSAPPPPTSASTNQPDKAIQLEKELQIYKKTCRELKKKIREWVLAGRLVADIDLHELTQGNSSSRPNTCPSGPDSLFLSADPSKHPASTRSYHPQDYAGSTNPPVVHKMPGSPGGSARWERVDSASTAASGDDNSKRPPSSAHLGGGRLGVNNSSIAGSVGGVDSSKARRSHVSVYDSLEDQPPP